jgi:hypothetical protein
MHKLPQPHQISELTLIKEQVQSLTSLKPSRKKNWRILSAWRELRKHKIPYYFLSQNQIAVQPNKFGRSAFIISIEKVSVPGVSWFVDFYSVKQCDTGTSLSLNCTSGASLIQKLLRFSFLHVSDMEGSEMPHRYEPFVYCPMCNARNRMYATTCEECGAILL